MKGSLDLMKALRDKSTTFEKTEHGSYFGTTPIRRIIIYLAGPLMNICRENLESGCCCTYIILSGALSRSVKAARNRKRRQDNLIGEYRLP